MKNLNEKTYIALYSAGIMSKDKSRLTVGWLISDYDLTTMDLHHPILREFPDDRETIKRLKASDERFRKMFEEYHQLDDAIYRIEEEIEFASDQETEEMKKRRAWLKDQIYHAIKHPSFAIAAAAMHAQQPQRAVATP